MAQAGGGQIETRLPIWKRADDFRAPTDFPHQPLQGIVRPELAPMTVREGVITQRLLDAFFDQISHLAQPLGTQTAHNRSGFF